MAGQARRAQECRRVSPAESSLPSWEGPGRWGPWLTPAHPHWGLGEGPGCRSRPPPPPTCTPAPCPAERPQPSVAHWLRPCSATLPGPADAGPGLEARSLEFRSCTQAALCLCLGETKMRGSGMPSPELGPAHSRQREWGWGCGWGWILPGSPPQGARRPAPTLPSPLHSPRWMSGTFFLREEEASAAAPSLAREWGLGYSCQQDRPVGPVGLSCDL